jgi:Holliday junction resolvase RusA-like endonuclease
MIRFIVYGTPLPKGSAKAFIPKGWTRPVITSTTKGLKAWEQQIASAAQVVASGTLLTGAVHVRIDFLLQRPKSLPKKIMLNTKRPDLDKLIRGAIDALTGVVWKDDAQAIEIHASKGYTVGDQAPQATFEIL